VENVHQILLLSIIDLIIGNEVYPVNWFLNLKKIILKLSKIL
jgi:hypothetical protein